MIGKKIYKNRRLRQAELLYYNTVAPISLLSSLKLVPIPRV